MKKYLVIVMILALVISTAYASSWMKSYMKARAYYADAMENYNNNELGISLKGKKVQKEDGSGYMYSGGFQQSLEVFEGEFAFPKPALIESAEDMCIRIIQEMDEEEAKTLFKSYFGIDNRYLPDVMIHLGGLYEEKGDKKRAKDTYSMVVDAFANDENACSEASERLTLMNE